MDQLCPYCDALHWLLERSTGSGSSVAYPLFTMFCNRGDIMLPPMIPPPEQLTHPFTAATLQTDGFHQNVHRYNAALAFTLLGVEVRRTSDILSPRRTLSSAWLLPSTRLSPSHTSTRAWYAVSQQGQWASTNCSEAQHWRRELSKPQPTVGASLHFSMCMGTDQRL